MQYGNLIVYDNDGVIWYQSGEMEGDLAPRTYPGGLNYIELPFGAMAGKRVVSVDVSGETHVPVFEDIPVTETTDQKITALQNQLSLVQSALDDLILGGAL